MLKLKDISETILFRELTSRRQKTISPDNVEALCGEAADRMKLMPAFHPQFTLHDDAHLLRVTELMGIILNSKTARAAGKQSRKAAARKRASGVIGELNEIELALLILAAHFHDQGMVPDAIEQEKIRQSEAFRIHRDLWITDHPNFREMQEQLAAPQLDVESRSAIAVKVAELELAVWSDYLRKTHGERSEALVREHFKDDGRLVADGVSLAPSLATLCVSHVHDARDLKDLPLDKLIGTHPVNLRYLAVLLRLADVLDFDRERTPDVLYRTIHFTSEVSVREWEKHRGVQGWEIRDDSVRFEMEFDHPIYEKAARDFLDYIDAELAAAYEMVKSFPADFSHYELNLPIRVDRSRIGPRSSAYEYHDLEFSLSRDEIVKLLMTDKLYGSPALCVRELLQNALDALRYRRALSEFGGYHWTEGRVEFEHGQDEHGQEFLRCRDNGIGMSEDVITKFLTKVGRSYYRSPLFEQERVRFRQKKGLDFDPCSRFGIGFMSCFMVGDQIRVETRRDNGPGQPFGTPWIIEINGLSSMLVMRRGMESQAVGTTVVITCRKKPEAADAEDDQIQLVQTLKEYARAVDYPVTGACSLSGIAGSITIEPGVRRPVTFLEAAGVKSLLRIEEDVSKLDDSGLVSGWVAETFLADENGWPVLCNADACWEQYDTSARIAKRVDDVQGYFSARNLRLRTRTGGVLKINPTGVDFAICADGIRIASHPNSPSVGDMVPRAALIDTRGQRKPRLTPAREPTADDQSWRLIWGLEYLTRGRILVKLSQFLPDRLTYDRWRKLIAIYGLNTRSMPDDVVWERIPIRIITLDGTAEYVPLAQIGNVAFEPRPGLAGLFTSRGEVEISDVGDVLRFVELSIEGERWQLRTRRTSAVNFGAPLYVGGLNTYPVSFDREIGHLLYAWIGATLVNRHHPLVAGTEGKFNDKLRKFMWDLIGAAPLGPGELSPHMLKNRRDAGESYLKVRWNKHPDLAPPYKTFSTETGWGEITEAQLREWAKIQVSEDD